ncbi:single-stranded DNA-binding protein, partial [Candidatus Phytoplasma phoenicium]
MINEIRLMGHLTHDLKKEYVKIN